MEKRVNPTLLRKPVYNLSHALTSFLDSILLFLHYILSKIDWITVKNNLHSVRSTKFYPKSIHK